VRCLTALLQGSVGLLVGFQAFAEDDILAQDFAAEKLQLEESQKPRVREAWDMAAARRKNRGANGRKPWSDTVPLSPC
jgi:hypothetical protein